jgi:hypothetical protein
VSSQQQRTLDVFIMMKMRSTRTRLSAVLAHVACTVLIGLSAATARGQNDVPGSYIENAVPMNQFRLRFESVDGINRSDRAEYIYSKGFDPKIAYQDLAPYVEMLLLPRFSAFVEVREHFVNPELAPNNYGFGDMNVGGKYAVVCQEDQVLSVFLRTYIPTGMPKLSILGTGHVSLDPALLYSRQLTDRLALQAELHDYIPIGGSDFQGNVLRYGVGFNYKLYEHGQFTVAPIAEFVGWTVLNGKESVGTTPAGDLLIKEAGGDTIINAKMGVRVGFTECADLYLGYGRALTGAVWYKDLYRVELRFKF